MRKFIWTLVLMLCIAGQTTLAAELSKFIILHTNDTHGFDMHGDGHIGMAGIAEYKKDLEMNGYDVVMLDAGDAIQDNNLVNFSKGKVAVEFMNAVGYHAAALGNHEFDYGQEVLRQRIKEAQYPYVSSNIIVDATKKHFVQPTKVLSFKSGKIGVIGFSTPETVVSTSPKNVYGLTFKEKKALYKEANKHIKKLKKEGCDVIIGLGHLGSEDGCMGNRAEDVIMNTKGLDIMIDGHDHKVKNQYVNNVLLVEAGNYTKNIGKITYDGNKWVADLVTYNQFVKEFKEVDPTLDGMVKKAQAEVNAHLGQVVGKSVQFMDGARQPGVRTQEMAIGDFIADAYLWQARQANVLQGPVDAAIINGGSIRSSLPAGTLKRADIISCAPYNNQLYLIKIKGSKLLEIMEAATCVLPDAMGGLPQVAGMEYTVDTRVPYAQGEKYPNSVFYAPAKPGSRVTIHSVAGKPFDLNASYTVVSTEFVVAGGDNYGGLALPGAKEAAQSIGYVDAEAMENYLVTELGGTIGEVYANPQGRFTVIK